MDPAQVSALIEQRLAAAGVQLTLGGEPTYVPDEPEGAEWAFAADGPTKLGYARALAAQLQQRAWPGSTLMYCPGKRYDGEVNPRWALRLFTGPTGDPVVAWPQSDGAPGPCCRLGRPQASWRRSAAASAASSSPWNCAIPSTGSAASGRPPEFQRWSR